MAATLALLTTTALSGAALAASDTPSTTAAPANLIVLAQAADGGSSGGAGGATGNDASGTNNGTGGMNNGTDSSTGDQSATGDDADQDGANADADDAENTETDLNDTQQSPQGDQVGSGVQIEPGPNTPTDQGVGGQPGITAETADPSTEISPAAGPASGAYRSYSEAPEAGGTVIAGGYGADDFIGRNVVNAEGEDLGEVVDLMIDDDGNASKVVADIGGFLGIGESRVAIDMADITVEQGSGGLLVEMDQDELEMLPAYELEDGIWVPEAN